MNTVLAVNKPTQWLAGILAVAATLISVGGPLTLAEHYARTGAAWNPAGYSAAQMATRTTCPTIENRQTAANSKRVGVNHNGRHGTA